MILFIKNPKAIPIVVTNNCSKFFICFFSLARWFHILLFFPLLLVHSRVNWRVAKLVWGGKLNTVDIQYYYIIDVSVLLENNQWYIFHILTNEDIDDIIYLFLHWIYIIKRTLHRDLKIWILSSRDENNILPIRYAHS